VVLPRILKQETESKFLKVKCRSCGNEQIIFNKTSREITCRICGDTVAKPTGGLADIKGDVIENLE